MQQDMAGRSCRTGNATDGWSSGTLSCVDPGLTEFLPVSSSAHLILPSQLLGWPDQGLAFDVAVRGTLVAVMVYYRESLTSLLMGLLGSGITSACSVEKSQRCGATLPAVGIGLAFSDVIDQYLRGIGVIATTTLLFGLLLVSLTRIVPRESMSS